MNINWRFVLSKWWKAALMGLLIAIGIAMFPQAQCAVAQTCNAPRDLWCNNGQPGKCCDPATGFTAVVGCTYVSGVTPHCKEEVTTIPVRCQNSSNCEVTQVLDSPNRLSSGYWYVGSCDWSPVGNSCGDPKTNTNSVRATCCTGSSGSGGGCTPEYAPPDDRRHLHGRSAISHSLGAGTTAVREKPWG